MTDRKPKPRETPTRTSQRTPGRELSARWAAGILALLLVLFFHEVVVGGKTFVSPDATAPAGFARIGEQSLNHDHVYPLWNPYVFLGMPSFASGTYNPLIYPPDWPVAVLQKFLPLPELTWMLLYYFLGAFALFLLAREWGATAGAALLGAAAFVFAPNLIAVGSHGHGSQLVDSAYLPMMLWLATRWMRRGRLSDLAWLALAGGFQLLRGHVQICFYTWMAVVLYTVCEWGAAWRAGRLPAATARAAGVAAAALLAFGLAGFYNLPLSDYAKHSIRGTAEGGGVDRAYATQWSLAPYELPSFVVPGWVGFGGQTYWGGMPFTDYPNGYVGMVTVLLALPAFLAGGVPRVFALLLAAFALMISFGRNFPLYGLLYDHLPLFNRFRVPVMIILLFQLAAALGLAWGWTAWSRPDSVPAQRTRAFDRMVLVAALVLALALVFGAFAGSAGERAYASLAAASRASAGEGYPADLAAIAYRGFVGDLMRVSFIGLLALGLAWAVRRGKLGTSLATAGVLALLLIELWPVSGRVMGTALGDPAQRNQELSKDDVVEFLQSQGNAGEFRVLPTQEFQSNRYAAFAISSMGGYHAAKPQLIQNVIKSGAGQNPAWLRLLNIRFLLLPQPVSMPQDMSQVFQGSQVVYENHSALPRAMVLGQYAVVTPDTAIIDSIAYNMRDTGISTYLTEDPHLTLGPVTGATARVTSYRLNDVTVEVETPGPGLLRLGDLWYPDWTARVDGRKVPVLRADYLLRAVAVPAGRHRVEFRFESPAVRRGLVVSIACLVLVLGLFATAFVRGRRRDPVAVATEAA